MNLRLANMYDLPKIKVIYGKIIDNMNKNNIQIWNEIYPCEVFYDDIVNYLRKGIGSVMINKAIAIARDSSAKYIRLFVVDINKPAINFYLKNGFKQVDGIYEERIDDFVLSEYGFEIKV